MNGFKDQKEYREPEENLFDGSIWEEHDGWLVGDEKGLGKLIRLADKAIQKGEADEEIGDFAGVRCLDTSFFENQSHKFGKGTLVVVLLLILIFGVGIYNIGKWIFQFIF